MKYTINTNHRKKKKTETMHRMNTVTCSRLINAANGTINGGECTLHVAVR